MQVPLVLTDLSVPPADAATLTATARRLAPTCDALLVGDHQDRPDFPPSVLARLIADAGARPWVTLACRDRNRVVLEQELAGLRLDGRATVLCVTGDGRAAHVRPEVTQVFDLDGTRLAGLAAALGLPVAVAETPNAPPLRLRPERLVRKQQAGAGVGVLNHVRTAGQVAEFLTAARRAGLTMPVVASVAVYTDERSAGVLTALPGLEIEPAAVAAVLALAGPGRGRDRDRGGGGGGAARRARRCRGQPLGDGLSPGRGLRRRRAGRDRPPDPGGSARGRRDGRPPVSEERLR